MPTNVNRAVATLRRAEKNYTNRAGYNNEELRVVRNLGPNARRNMNEARRQLNEAMNRNVNSLAAKYRQTFTNILKLSTKRNEGNKVMKEIQNLKNLRETLRKAKELRHRILSRKFSNEAISKFIRVQLHAPGGALYKLTKKRFSRIQ
jgi:hypothetical protein